MNAKRAIHVIAAALVTISLAGCVDDELTRPTRAVNQTIAAHDPSLHGLSASVLPSALPSYTTLDDASASGVTGALTLEVDAAGTVPRFPDAFISGVAVFGFAWADLATGQAVVAVIHPAIGRDSNQNPDAWHTHPVELTAGTGTSNFCIVSIGTSQGGIAITGDRLRVTMGLNQAGVAADNLDVAAAFIVEPNSGCAATGLGVVVLSAVNL